MGEAVMAAGRDESGPELRVRVGGNTAAVCEDPEVLATILAAVVVAFVILVVAVTFPCYYNFYSSFYRWTFIIVISVPIIILDL